MSTDRASRACCALLVAAAGVCGASGSAGAQLTLLPAGPMIADRSANLVVNGSFELPGSGPGSLQPNWVAGSSAYQVTPPGWTSSGSVSSYGTWGNDGPGGPRLRNSDILPHGRNALYFGNGQTAMPLSAPIYNPSGEVTFAGTPGVISGPSFPSPVGLFQTIALPAASSYVLSFWVSGEGSGFNGPGPLDGIFGMSLTNTDPGDPTRYFAAPQVGSRRYEFSFTTLNPSLPVALRFVNWGHLSIGGGTTELVLDDVIINAVPGPGAAVVFAIGGVMVGRRRR
jgi:hypothetical protein